MSSKLNLECRALQTLNQGSKYAHLVLRLLQCQPNVPSFQTWVFVRNAQATNLAMKNTENYRKRNISKYVCS